MSMKFLLQLEHTMISPPKKIHHIRPQNCNYKLFTRKRRSKLQQKLYTQALLSYVHFLGLLMRVQQN